MGLGPLHPGREGNGGKDGVEGEGRGGEGEEISIHGLELVAPPLGQEMERVYSYNPGARIWLHIQEMQLSISSYTLNMQVQHWISNKSGFINRVRINTSFLLHLNIY